MNMLLEQFKNIFDRPEKVKKLRELILELAVRGKLVEQNENDEPASVLLKRIKEAKERLVKEGKIKKEKPLPEISEDEKPCELPKSWEWVRMCKVAENIHYGYTASATDTDTGTKFLRITDIQNNKVNWSTVPFCEIEEKKLSTCLLRNNDILIARTGGTIGKSFIVKNVDCNAVFASYLIRVIPIININPDYLKLFLETPLYWKQLIAKSQGTGQPNVNAVSLSELAMPLPPLNQQKQIIERVYSLIHLCDSLEKELQRKINYSSLSSKSVFNSIDNCSSLEELEEKLRFIIKNFKDLTLSDDEIKEFKNAILQLAVQGKLVSQDSQDEPASVLLEKIKKEKERLIKEGKIKKEKLLPEINEDEKLYELPTGWEWVRINDLSSAIDYGTSTKADLDVNKVPVLRMNNINNGKIDFSNLKYVDSDIKDLPRLYLKKDDILFNRTNSYELVGKTAVYKGLSDKYTFASYLIRITMFNSLLGVDYINIVMNSNLYRKTQIEPQITQQNGQANFNGTKLKSTLVPLPPLNEQKRIVEKVESLMSLCDELEKRIEKSKRYSEKLMEAILKNEFAQI